MMAEGGVEEFFQETTQNIATNWTVQQTYDASQTLLEGVGEAGLFALMSGGIFSGMSGAIQRLANDPNLSEEDKIKLSQAQENLREYERQLKAQSFNDIKQSYEIGQRVNKNK